MKLVLLDTENVSTYTVFIEIMFDTDTVRNRKCLKQICLIQIMFDIDTVYYIYCLIQILFGTGPV